MYLVIFLFFVGLDLNAQNSFIENKGQFPTQVKAKVVLPSGALFIEEGRLIYAFYSEEHLSSIHDLTALSKAVDAHAYSVNFVNSNTNILTTLIQESNYYENYFLGDQSKWATNVKSYKSVYQKDVYS